MNEKHTPKPWIRHGTMIHGENGQYVARIQRGSLSPEGVDANGSLIEAAPDLADALRELTDYAEAMRRIFAHPSFTDRHGDAERSERMYVKGQAALAKAGL